MKKTELNEEQICDVIMMYRQAADKKMQIRILSELFLVTRQKICEILKGRGYEDSYILAELNATKKAFSNGNGWSAHEEDRLRQLRADRFTYEECARELGRTKSAVAAKIYQLGI